MSKRRPHGSGTIVERAPGVYVICVDAGVDPLTGRRRRPGKTIRGTKKEAQAELTRMLNASGEPAPAKLTVGELLRRVMGLRRLGELTRQDWDRVISAYIAPELGRQRRSRRVVRSQRRVTLTVVR